MSARTTQTLPPNPYKRSPIRKREDLAGRARELKSIRYYLGLTAAGQSPHLALIGQRGVGKTSLLNGAESIAKDLSLLPVRLDMNEQKASSQWIFWHDLYQSLTLAMAKAGSWGGIQGKIYGELLRMIHARQPGNLDHAVLQIPYVFSCHQGAIESFECPDALVVHDFEACMLELQSKGFKGIAILIDEADCLGKNVPLLQMFRNIFQIVDNCSLLLAGTDSVFPALSEVFSPIPRQFHRIDVKPFARWSDTLELVLRPISKDLFETIAPEPDVVRELHDLCGGAPDEVQLYCHHMYRSVEDRSSKRMALAPQVFREVLREYRSNSPANVDAVLNSIERLPDKLLYESSWLSRRNVTLEENIKISLLRQELNINRQLSVDERDAVVLELTEGYRILFEAGITELSNCIRLAGAPLSAGFWKSFVEVERGQRWKWDDESFAENLRNPILRTLGMSCGAVGQIDLGIIAKDDAVNALLSIRAGQKPADFDEGMAEMIISALYARDLQILRVSDVSFTIESPAGKQTQKCRFFEKTDKQLKKSDFEQWLDDHRALLSGNNISIQITDFRSWELPSPIELHRLGRIAGYRIPEVFGPTETEQAVERFGDGDIEGCMDRFSEMLEDKEAASTRNNLAFCQILKGDFQAASKNTKLAIESEYEPLYELNKGIADFLLGDTAAAKESLKNALKRIRHAATDEFTRAAYVLVLSPKGTEEKVRSYSDLPLEAAILINLFLVGGMTRDELQNELNRLNQAKSEEWVKTIAEG